MSKAGKVVYGMLFTLILPIGLILCKACPEIASGEFVVIFVLIVLITQGNEAILDHSMRFLHFPNTEWDKPCFSNLYMRYLRYKRPTIRKNRNYMHNIVD